MLLLEKRIGAAQKVMTARWLELIGTQKNRSEIGGVEKARRTLTVIKWERLGRAA